MTRDCEIKWLVLFVIWLQITGCTLSGYEQKLKVSDREVDRLINLAPFKEGLQPRQRPQIHNPQQPEKLTLSLKDCLTLALENNREYLAQVENLFLQEIDLRVQRRNYWPILSSITISPKYTSAYTASTSTIPSFTDRTAATSGTIGITQTIPWGGSLGFSTSIATTRYATPAGSVTSNFNLTLPIIKGQGLIPGSEPLIMAHRSYQYKKREFTNFKQMFLIDIVSNYFSILQQEKAIKNFKDNLQKAKAVLDEATVRQEAGQVSKVDLFRAQFNYTQAKNELELALENLRLIYDAFKIQLGLPPEVEIALEPEEIKFTEIDVDEEKYTNEVLEGNFLWLNTQDQFEDAKRALLLAYDKTKIQLDLTTNISQTEDTEPLLRGYEKRQKSWEVGLSLTIPLYRLPLDRDYQAAVTQFVQQERNFRLSYDQLQREAREKIITLRRAQLNVTAQKQSIKQAEDALTLLMEEYRQLKVRNLDLIEAQNNLIRAKNAYLAALVDYKIALLRLRQFTGKMEFDPEGKWFKE